MTLPVQFLIGAALAGYAASLACFSAAIRREQTGPAQAGRALSALSALLLTAACLALASVRGGPPLTSMAEFLILLALVQTGGALALDYFRRMGLLTLGNAAACVLILAVALLSPDPVDRSGGTESGLHIATFMASLVALEVSFVSSLTHLLLKRFLKTKGHLWIFELAPSLEAVRRTAMVSLLVGFSALTAGILAGYLFARSRSPAGAGWRFDVTIVLATATWAAYLATLLAGARSRFHGRWAAALNLGSFFLLMLTLLLTTFSSKLHRGL
jgi:ABC-type uncharacterized transport system permease subunit